MSERWCVQTPAVEIIFHAPLIWIKSLEQKLIDNKPGLVAYAVIMQKGGGGVDFEKDWLINPASKG